MQTTKYAIVGSCPITETSTVAIIVIVLFRLVQVLNQFAQYSQNEEPRDCKLDFDSF